MDNDLKNQVEFLGFKLKGGATELTILKWLENFDIEERDDMLELLLYLEFIGANDIFDFYNQLLNMSSISSCNENDLMIFHPLGEYVKSGTAMVYYMKKALRNKPYSYRFATTTRDIEKIVKATEYTGKKILILFDDILGTGNSAIKYIKDNGIKERFYTNHKVSKILIFSLVSAKEARNNIKADFPEIEVNIANEREAIFSDKNMVFENKIIRNRIREISYRYGEKLKIPKSEIEPLGYKNSQCMVSFAYGTPNNTLPIIWSDKNGWYPLMPRSTKKRIDYAKRERKNIAHMLGAMYIMGKSHFYGLYSSDELEGKIKKCRFDKIATLVWLTEGIDESIIAQRLCLTINEVNQIYKELKDEGYIEDIISLKFTNKALEFISDIKRTYKQNGIISRQDVAFRELTYTPKTFRGITIG